jgi:hypothetical protein
MALANPSTPTQAIDEIFYVRNFLTIIITCTFLVELEVQERKFGSYMRTKITEYDQGYYNHGENITCLHVSMRNSKTESNGKRGRKNPITMIRLQREVQSYREDNERIMKAHEEILQILNMFHKQVNKDPGPNQEPSARKVSGSKFQRKRVDHGNDRKSRIIIRHHHYPKKSTRRTHESSNLGSIPSVSLVRRQKRRPKEDILQGEIRKIKPNTINGENRKGK